MVDLLVGHGPVPSHSPYVPDFLVVKDEQGRLHVHSRQGRIDVPVERAIRDHLVASCDIEPLRPGKWPLIQVLEPESGPPFKSSVADWFSLDEEASWRSARAQALLRESTTLKGDPEAALRSIRAAAALVAVDLDKTVRELRAQAAPGETLSEVLERRKR